MTKTAVVFGLAAMLVATSAFAQSAPAPGSRTTAAPGGGQTMTAPDTKALAPLPDRQPRPVFTIFNMPVVVWAPIQPPYDPRSKLEPSGNPSWLDGENPM